MSKLLKHLARLEIDSAIFSIEQAKAFCLLCLERQKFAYDKARTIITPEASEVARIYLDLLWHDVLPRETLPLFEARSQSEDAALNFIFSIFAFIEINSLNIPSSCRAVAEFSLNTADALAHDFLNIPVGRDGDDLIDSSSFVLSEMMRQESDFYKIKNVPPPIDVEDIKRNSQIDITQGVWFVD